MNLAGIYHRAFSNMAYSLNEDTIRIQIFTGKNIDAVNIIYGDPFKGAVEGVNWGWDAEPIQAITQVIELQQQNVWYIDIQPKYKRLKYYFELTENGEKIYYSEAGFLKEGELKDIGLQAFKRGWLNPIDLNKTPQWVKDACWYQIFPDRFCNAGNVGKGIRKWSNGEVSNSHRYGGNLKGITSKISYLFDLGITAIYLTPIFKAKSIHKYDTIDYYEIDEDFGTKEDFTDLMTTAHKAGIKIILDGVFNHCGGLFGPWLDVVENGEKSKYRNWFMVNEFPVNTQGSSEDHSFYTFAFTKDMPKLNTNNEEVIEYILNVCKYWAKTYHIDGLRLDVADEISHNLCKRMHRELKKINPDFYIMGEVWTDSIDWLQGDEFDSVMNYPLTTAINKFLATKDITKEEFMFQVNRAYSNYMKQNNDVLFNLLDSHDTNRLITRVNGNIDIFYQMLAILYTMQGSPCIYYGTEIALEGENDPDCRRCMSWDDMHKRIDVYEKVKSLINIRKKYAVTKNDKIVYHLYESEHLFGFSKIDAENGDLKVILNISSVEQEISVGNCDIIFENNYENGILKANGCAISFCANKQSHA